MQSTAAGNKGTIHSAILLWGDPSVAGAFKWAVQTKNASKLPSWLEPARYLHLSVATEKCIFSPMAAGSQLPVEGNQQRQTNYVLVCPLVQWKVFSQLPHIPVHFSTSGPLSINSWQLPVCFISDFNLMNVLAAKIRFLLLPDEPRNKTQKAWPKPLESLRTTGLYLPTSKSSNTCPLTRWS